MVMYANEFKTKEKQNLTENKKLTATYTSNSRFLTLFLPVVPQQFKVVTRRVHALR